MWTLTKFRTFHGKQIDLYERLEAYLHVRMVKHFNNLHLDDECEVAFCEYYMKSYHHINKCNGWRRCRYVPCRVLGRALAHWSDCTSRICTFCEPLRKVIPDNYLLAFNTNRANINESHARLAIRLSNPNED